MGRVQGKVAIVTGGAKGLGLASAEALIREGARALIADIDAGFGIGQAVSGFGHRVAMPRAAGEGKGVAGA